MVVSGGIVTPEDTKSDRKAIALTKAEQFKIHRHQKNLQPRNRKKENSGQESD